MVDLYVSPSCTSCRKARAWLEKHNIPFKERNIFSEPLTKEELSDILEEKNYATKADVLELKRIIEKLEEKIN